MIVACWRLRAAHGRRDASNRIEPSLRNGSAVGPPVHPTLNRDPHRYRWSGRRLAPRRRSGSGVCIDAAGARAARAGRGPTPAHAAARNWRDARRPSRTCSRLCGFVWIFGSQIAAQFDLLATDLPVGIRQILRELASDPWGAWFLQHAREVDLTGVTGKALAGVGTAFTAAIRAVTYGAVMLFAALYLAVQPARYRHGLLRLVPQHRRQRIAAISDLAGETLQRRVVEDALGDRRVWPLASRERIDG